MEEYSIHFDKVSEKVVNSTNQINELLQNAKINSFLNTNDEFDSNLKPTKNQNLKTDCDRPTVEEIDNLFEKLRQRPKQLSKPQLKKPSQQSIIVHDSGPVSTPRKNCDSNEIAALIRHNQQLLQSITNERLEEVNLENIEENQKKFTNHMLNNINSYESVYENLSNNVANATKGSQSCPIDESFNDAVKQLSQVSIKTLSR
jgi:hypothetical protein